MPNPFGVDPQLVAQALQATGSTYQLDPSVFQAPDIGPAPAPAPGIQRELPPDPSEAMARDVNLTGVRDPNIGDPVQVNQALKATGSDYQVPQVGSAQSAQDAMASMEQSARDQAKAARETAQIKQQQFAQESDAHAREQARVDELIAKHGDAQKAMEAEFEDSISRFRMINEEVAKMPPPRDSRSMGKKLMGALATGMGGASDHFAMVGGMKSNHAEQITQDINAGIERDIQAQREAIQNKRADAQAAMTEYGFARQHFGDTKEAVDFAITLRKQSAGHELARIAATSSSAQVAQEAASQEAALNGAVAKEKLAFARAVLAKKLSPFQARIMGWNDRQLNDYNNSIDAENGAPPLTSKARKVGNDEGKIDRARTEAVYERWVKIAPALDANDRLSKYTKESTIPADMVGSGKAIKEVKSLFTAGKVDFDSAAAKDLSADIEASRNAFLRLVSGAGITEQEGLRQWGEFGLDPGKYQTAKQLVAGIKKLNARTDYYNRLIRAPDPEAFDELDHRIHGGETRALGRTPVANGGRSGTGGGDAPKGTYVAPVVKF